jgi:hypothetical protein
MNFHNLPDNTLSLHTGNSNFVSALVKIADNSFTNADLKIHELNVKGRIEKTIARIRIEHDDKSPYKFLL